MTVYTAFFQAVFSFAAVGAVAAVWTGCAASPEQGNQYANIEHTLSIRAWPGWAGGRFHELFYFWTHHDDSSLYLRCDSHTLWPLRRWAGTGAGRRPGRHTAEGAD